MHNPWNKLRTICCTTKETPWTERRWKRVLFSLGISQEDETYCTCIVAWWYSTCCIVLSVLASNLGNEAISVLAWNSLQTFVHIGTDVQWFIRCHCKIYQGAYQCRSHLASVDEQTRTKVAVPYICATSHYCSNMAFGQICNMCVSGWTTERRQRRWGCRQTAELWANSRHRSKHLLDSGSAAIIPLFTATLHSESQLPCISWPMPPER